MNKWIIRHCVLLRLTVTYDDLYSSVLGKKYEALLQFAFLSRHSALSYANIRCFPSQRLATSVVWLLLRRVTWMSNFINEQSDPWHVSYQWFPYHSNINEYSERTHYMDTLDLVAASFSPFIICYYMESYPEDYLC